MLLFYEGPVLRIHNWEKSSAPGGIQTHDHEAWALPPHNGHFWKKWQNVIFHSVQRKWPLCALFPKTVPHLFVNEGPSTVLEPPGHLQGHSPRKFTPLGLLAPDDAITSRSSAFWSCPVQAVVVARPDLIRVGWFLIPIATKMTGIAFWILGSYIISIKQDHDYTSKEF